MPILEGPQGLEKSTAWRTLFSDPWYSDRLSALASKDASMEVSGTWGVEDAELESINRATVGRAKAFLSQLFDRYRPPYGKHVVRVPRQCILVGTKNPPPPDGRYLLDPTGDRRYWPIACSAVVDGKVDIAGLARDRNQLWGEAVARYQAGAKWHLETPALEALAAVEQDARFCANVYDHLIRDYVGDPNDPDCEVVCIDTSVPEILERVLGRAPSREPDAIATTGVPQSLVRLGFRRYRADHGRDENGRRMRPWRYTRCRKKS
jgi:predicted P-loop ATPase